MRSFLVLLLSALLPAGKIGAEAPAIQIQKLRIPRELMQDRLPTDEIMHRMTEEKLDELIRGHHQHVSTRTLRKPVSCTLRARFDEKTGRLIGRGVWHVPEGNLPVVELSPWNLIFQGLENGEEMTWGTTSTGRLRIQTDHTRPLELRIDWEYAAHREHDRWGLDLQLPGCAVASLELSVPENWKLRSSATVTPASSLQPPVSGLSNTYQLFFSGESRLACELIPPGSDRRGVIAWQSAEEYRFDQSRIELDVTLLLESLHERVQSVSLLLDEELRPQELAVNLPASWHRQEAGNGKIRWTATFRRPPFGPFRIEFRSVLPPTGGTVWRCPEIMVEDSLSRGEVLTFAIAPTLAIRQIVPSRYRQNFASLGSGGEYRLEFESPARSSVGDRPGIWLEPRRPRVDVSSAVFLDLTGAVASLAARIEWHCIQGTFLRPTAWISPGWEVERVLSDPVEGVLGFWTEPVQEGGTLVKLQLQKGLTSQETLPVTLYAVPSRRQSPADENEFPLPEIRSHDIRSNKESTYTLWLGSNSNFQTDDLPSALPVRPDFPIEIPPEGTRAYAFEYVSPLEDFSLVSSNAEHLNAEHLNAERGMRNAESMSERGMKIRKIPQSAFRVPHSNDEPGQADIRCWSISKEGQLVHHLSIWLDRRSPGPLLIHVPEDSFFWHMQLDGQSIDPAGVRGGQVEVTADLQPGPHVLDVKYSHSAGNEWWLPVAKLTMPLREWKIVSLLWKLELSERAYPLGTLGSRYSFWKSSESWNFDLQDFRANETEDFRANERIKVLILPVVWIELGSRLLAIVLGLTLVAVGWRRRIRTRPTALILLLLAILVTLLGGPLEVLLVAPVYAVGLALVLLAIKNHLVPLKTATAAIGLLSMLPSAVVHAQLATASDRDPERFEILIPFDRQDPSKENLALVPDRLLKILEEDHGTTSLGMLIRTADYEGELEDEDRVRWRATFQVHVDPLLEWASLNLSAIEPPVRVTVDGKPADFKPSGIGGRQEGLKVRLPEPETSQRSAVSGQRSAVSRTIQMEFITPVLGFHPQRELDFRVPFSARTSLRLSLSQRARVGGWRLEAGGWSISRDRGRVIISGNMGPTDHVRLRWREGDRRLEAGDRRLELTSAQWLDVRSQSRDFFSHLQYQVTGGDIQSLEIGLDPNLVVRRVDAPLLRGWRVFEAGDRRLEAGVGKEDRKQNPSPQPSPQRGEGVGPARRTLRLEFEEPLRETVDVAIYCLVRTQNSSRILFPELRPLGVDSETGMAAIRLPIGWTFEEVKGRNTEPVRLEEFEDLCKRLQSPFPDRIVLARQFLRRPLNLSLRASRPVPDWSVHQVIDLDPNPRARFAKITSSTQISVRSGSLNTLEFRMPIGFVLRGVTGEGLYQWFRSGRNVTILLERPIIDDWKVSISGRFFSRNRKRRPKTPISYTLGGLEWLGTKQIRTLWKLSSSKDGKIQVTGSGNVTFENSKDIVTKSPDSRRPEVLEIQSTEPNHWFRLQVERATPRANAKKITKKTIENEALPQPSDTTSNEPLAVRLIDVDLLCTQDGSVQALSRWELPQPSPGIVTIEIPTGCKCRKLSIDGREAGDRRLEAGGWKEEGRLSFPVTQGSARQEVILYWSMAPNSLSGDSLVLPRIAGDDNSSVLVRLRSPQNFRLNMPNTVSIDRQDWLLERLDRQIGIDDFESIFGQTSTDRTEYFLASSSLTQIEIDHPDDLGLAEWLGTKRLVRIAAAVSILLVLAIPLRARQ